MFCHVLSKLYVFLYDAHAFIIINMYSRNKVVVNVVVTVVAAAAAPAAVAEICDSVAKNAKFLLLSYQYSNAFRL